MRFRKGDISVTMWLIIGVLVLLSIIVVVLVLKGKGFAALDFLRGVLP